MNKIEMIEKYLDGNMSESEKKVFFDLVKHDQELSRELKLRSDINEFISEQDVIELRNILNDTCK